MNTELQNFQTLNLKNLKTSRRADSKTRKLKTLKFEKTRDSFLGHICIHMAHKITRHALYVSSSAQYVPPYMRVAMLKGACYIVRSHGVYLPQATHLSHTARWNSSPISYVTMAYTEFSSFVVLTRIRGFSSTMLIQIRSPRKVANKAVFCPNMRRCPRTVPYAKNCLNLEDMSTQYKSTKFSTRVYRLYPG